MARTVLAAVMTAPTAPIEVRELSRTRSAPGRRAPADRALGSLRHRRAPVARPALGRAVSQSSRARHDRHARRDSRHARRTSTAAGFREGDRVVFFDVHRTCGRCLACTVHRTPTRCPSRRVYGITDSAAEGLFGGWAQKVYLEPGVVVAKLPDAVTFEDYIGGGCGLLTAVHIIERARIALGDTVVVQGAGAVGLSAAALARRSGAGQVIVIGAPADRLDAGDCRWAPTSCIDIEATTPDERLSARSRTDQRARAPTS